MSILAISMEHLKEDSMDCNIKENKEVSNPLLLIDTNVFIYALEGKFDLLSLGPFSLCASIISKIELLGKKDIATDEIKQVKQKLLKVRVIKLDNSIENMAIKVKQQRHVKIPDAIIAATAIVKNLTLVTADVKLAKVEGLKVKLVQPEMDDTQKKQ
jgi:predicted nucleic acid-binding protein